MITKKEQNELGKLALKNGFEQTQPHMWTREGDELEFHGDHASLYIFDDLTGGSRTYPASFEEVRHFIETPTLSQRINKSKQEELEELALKNGFEKINDGYFRRGDDELLLNALFKINDGLELEVNFRNLAKDFGSILEAATFAQAKYFITS